MITLVLVTVELARAVVRHEPLPGLAHSPDWPHDDTFDALRPLADHPEHDRGGTFLVVEDGTVVGECGWFGPPDDDGLVRIGYGLARSVRGRGVGTEAVRQLLGWIGAQGAVTVRAEVLPGNDPSLRLLARLGFETVGEQDGHFVTALTLP